MVKAVFTTKVEPTYNDLPETRYHFPQTYLRQVQASLGDWIVYYEPRRSTGDLLSRGGRQSYFATARVAEVRPDPKLQNHYYAHVEGFLPFTRPVPFREGTSYFERALVKLDATTNKGAFGRAVRLISDAEYEAILLNGFAFPLGMTPRLRQGNDPPEEVSFSGFSHAEQAPYVPELVERPTIQTVLSRPFRDRAFAAAVKTAYRDTCAITGLKLINGGGRSEVEAAHIRPVSESGPDSVRNGIALSATAHWMFDRGLISIDGDFRLMVSAKASTTQFRGLIEPGRPIHLPDRADDRPHPQFLDFHRRTFFER